MMTADQNAYSMSLKQLLDDFCDQNLTDNIRITGLTLDSRKVSVGDLFIACAGTQQHGAEFIPAAVKAGAVAIVYEADYPLQLPKLPVPIISIKNLGVIAGQIANRFYQYPSERINVIGITGTNGKTSTSWFLAESLHADNNPVGMIGTLGTGLFGNLQDTKNTTPDVVTVHRLLAEYCDAGARYTVMEVSSHAIEQNRISAVNFYTVIYTNLSHEHLDYHSSMQQYAEVKQRLFTDYSSNYKVINIDDEYGRQIADIASPPVYLYSVDDNRKPAGDTLVALIKETTNNFLQFDLKSPWGDCCVETQLIGNFNAYNLISVICVLCLTGDSLESAVGKVSKLTNVPGRMECFGNNQNNALIVVDYAHTPDALENVLKTLRKYSRGRLVTLFGCGGDRDQSKRSKMGEIADTYSDYIIITNDNPRTEDPKKIISQIKSGISNKASVYIEPDRSKAISYAVSISNPDDVVLIAGKGHENYQIIGDKTYDFDDRLQVQQYLEAKGD